MIIFSSLLAAQREGFLAIDFDRETGLYIVERTRVNRVNGKKERMLAFARGEEN